MPGVEKVGEIGGGGGGRGERKKRRAGWVYKELAE